MNLNPDRTLHNRRHHDFFFFSNQSRGEPSRSLVVELSRCYNMVGEIINEKRLRVLSAVMLILASQRIESVIGNWMGRDVVEQDTVPTKRGAAPTIIEW